MSNVINLRDYKYSPKPKRRTVDTETILDMLEKLLDDGNDIQPRERDILVSLWKYIDAIST